MSKEERLDFVYGILAFSTNHKPSLKAFWSVAKDMGLTSEEFWQWAIDKRWWPEK